MAKKKITLVSADSGDWEGLYLDDELVVENHSLTVEEVLKHCGVKFDSFEVNLDEIGRCPETLTEAKQIRTE